MKGEHNFENILCISCRVVSALVLKGEHNKKSAQDILNNVVSALVLKGEHNKKSAQDILNNVVSALVLKGEHNDCMKCACLVQVVSALVLKGEHNIFYFFSLVIFIFNKIIMYEYLDSYSTPENIRQVLSRLEQEGILRRIAHGIYLICDRRSL